MKEKGKEGGRECWGTCVLPACVSHTPGVRIPQVEFNIKNVTGHMKGRYGCMFGDSVKTTPQDFSMDSHVNLGKSLHFIVPLFGLL